MTKFYKVFGFTEDGLKLSSVFADYDHQVQYEKNVENHRKLHWGPIAGFNSFENTLGFIKREGIGVCRRIVIFEIDGVVSTDTNVWCLDGDHVVGPATWDVPIKYPEGTVFLDSFTIKGEPIYDTLDAKRKW